MQGFAVLVSAVAAVISALAAGFSAFASWSNGRGIAALREDLATVKGAWQATSDTLNAHVNTPGLHGP